ISSTITTTLSVNSQAQTTTSSTVIDQKKWISKNSCHHRVLKHSPYSVLFGTEPKVGLASTSLHPSIFDNTTTEEQLNEELNTPNNLNITNDNECVDEEDQVDLINYEKQNDNEQDFQSSNIIINQTSTSLNNQIKTTDAIRKDARKDQKRQADQFLQNTFKQQKLTHFNVGDNVLIPIPDVDRGPPDARNVLGVIIEVKDDQIKLGTTKGILCGNYSYHQVSKALGLPTLLIEHIPQGIPKSLREIVKLQSVTGDQGLLKCDYKQGCRTTKCSCKQANVM
ncbi:unnamed protein product, partial [Rotaria sp. Silwood1]